MPTNLPPECSEIEARLRAASSTREKIACIEELLSCIPKHKGTDHLRASLRRRLSTLRDEAGVKRGTGRQITPFRIDKAGAGQVAVVGYPNVGKSALLVALTAARPEVSDCPFTTWTPTAGMMAYEDVEVQLIDTPPLNADYLDPEFVGLLRRADLILVVLDLQGPAIAQLQDTLRLLGEQNIVPEAQRDSVPDASRVTFKPMLFVVNKDDDPTWDGDFDALCELFEGSCPLLPASAVTGRNLDGLRRVIFEALKVVRVYSKPPGREPDLDAPFTVPRGTTVGELAGKIHKTLAQNLRAARIWGQGAFDGQLVGPEYLLHDRDIVELRA